MSETPGVPGCVLRVCRNPDYYTTIDHKLRLVSDVSDDVFESRINDVAESGQDYIVRLEECDVEVFTRAGYVRWWYKLDGRPTRVAADAEVVRDV